MINLKPYFIGLLLILQWGSLHSQDISVEALGLKVPPLHNCTVVKDQSNSSTCWSFSSISLLESEEMKMGKGMQDLSEMFVARYSYIRKIETHLRLKGKNFFTPGGQFHDVAWVMKNYGMVPESIYNGKVNGESAHDHSELDTAILHLLNNLLSKNITVLTTEHYRILDSILDQHLGKVPVEFRYKGSRYTPKTFLKNYLQIDPADYVEITSYTHHPFYKPFVLEDKYNWTGDAYHNVPINEFIAISNNALAKGYTISWDGDVEEPTFNFLGNIAYLPAPIANLQTERQQSFEDGSTSIDHMMHIVALVKDKNNNDWYLVKNSWGTVSNKLKGYLFMSRDYFAIKTGAIIVNKNAIPLEIRRKMGL